jgi:hypothetical protein
MLNVTFTGGHVSSYWRSLASIQSNGGLPEGTCVILVDMLVDLKHVRRMPFSFDLNSIDSVSPDPLVTKSMMLFESLSSLQV